MKLSRAAVALYIGLVFASGAVLGVFGDRLYTVSTNVNKAKRLKTSPEELRKMRLKEAKERLSLSEDQVTKLGLIYDETRARYEEQRQHSIPELQKINKDQIEKIRAILTPSQRDEYNRILKEREERGKKGGGHPPGPGF
jgi:hypothetical protein